MMKAKLPFDATLRDLTGAKTQQTEYVRKVLENFYMPNVDKNTTKVRIGVVGSGHSPHYRFDFLTDIFCKGKPLSVISSFVFNGISHKEMQAFAAEQIREEHWSCKTMSHDEVANLLGELRKTASLLRH